MDNERALIDAIHDLIHRFDASAIYEVENLRNSGLKDIHADGSWCGSITFNDFLAASYIHIEFEINGDKKYFSWWVEVSNYGSDFEVKCSVNCKNRFRYMVFSGNSRSIDLAVEDIKRALESCFIDLRFCLKDRMFLKLLDIKAHGFPFLPSNPLRSDLYA